MTFLQVRFAIAFSLVVALVAAQAGFVAVPATAAELEIPHNSLVPEVPRVGLPEILDGDVYAIEEIDNWIVIGGDFTQVRLADGTPIAQPYLAAFDKDTGEFVDSFSPQLDGEVRSIAAGLDHGEIFVGGKFNFVNGKARRKLAKLNADGSPTTGWIAHASAVVTDIDITDTGRMFVGGAFKKLDGADVEVVGEIDPATGDVVDSFSFSFEGEGGWFSGGQSTRHIEALPGGTELLVVHSAETIDGLQRIAAAIFDISAPAAPFLTDYSISSFFDGAPYGALPTNADLAPDGTFFAISTNIGNSPPWHDMVLAFPTAGGPNTQPIWTHAMRDSVFAIGISNNAVYAGGHFCKIDEGPGVTVTQGRDDIICSGGFSNDGAWRWQLAALDPGDGTPFDWDPGTNAGRGVQELTVTDRGLLIGHDGSEIGNRSVGRAGFMDLGAASLDSNAPVVAIDTPTAGEIVGNPFVVAGTTSDDRRVLSVKVRVQNNITNEWVQADGSLGPAVYDFTTSPTSYPNETSAWSMEIFAPDGQYRVEARAIDSAGLVSVKPQFSFSVGVPAGPTCSAELTAEGSVDLIWSAIDGEDKYSVRRDGTFLATVTAGALTYTDTTATPGTHSYLIRSTQSGTTTNVDCGTITIADAPAPTCSLSHGVGDDVRIDWEAIDGEDKYSVRRDGTFLANVTAGALSYTDSAAAPGTHSYVVRSKQAGVTSNVDCGTITIADAPSPTCMLSAVPGGVEVAWSAIADEDEYSVRRNGTFLATVSTGALSYSDTSVMPGSHEYIIRSFQQGTQTNVDCGTITIP
ncbi:MAG: delta-60 repeat domain-containing protein [Acidimicrobiales bacterium]